jgi:flavodoxin
MKTLVVFYSRTGTTKKVGELIAQKLNAEIEEIQDTTDRSGAKGYLISGRDAMQRKLTELKPLKSNLSEYDLAIIGTPIWGWNMSVPIRTFLTEQKDKLKKVAFFCTMGGSGDKKAFQEMEGIIGKKPEAALALSTREVAKNDFISPVEKFIADFKLLEN